jgi:malonate transporter and related proteins
VQALLDVILPVFLVIGAGYLAVRLNAFSDAGVEGLMKFTQNFAIPCLLFAAIARLDLQAALNWALLGSFYAGATVGFLAGLLGARFLFGRAWEDSIAIGFACLFSNSVLLGLPITERAYGAGALEANFAIVAFHAPFCYAVGMTVMEVVRNRGGGFGTTLARLGRAVFSNALVIGILLGFAVNLSGLPIPGVVDDALDLLIRAALPTALFGLGGVLVRYRLEGDLRIIAWICGVSLILHPAVVWTLGQATGLSTPALRSAVLTAAMPPGVNTYIFAAMYGVAMRVAASAVLIATALSVVTAWLWLGVLP